MHRAVLGTSVGVSLLVHAGLIGLLLMTARAPVSFDRPIQVRILEPPPLPVQPSVPAPVPQLSPPPVPRVAPPRKATRLPQKTERPAEVAPVPKTEPAPRGEAPPLARQGSSEPEALAERLRPPEAPRLPPAPAPAPTPIPAPVAPAVPEPAPQVAARPDPQPVPPPPGPRLESPGEPSAPRSGLSLGGPPRDMPTPQPAPSPSRSARPSLRDQIAGIGSGLLPDTGGPAKQTVNLDDRRPRFLSYLARLKQQIQSEWTYPEEARRVGMGGELVLVFTLNPAGTLTHIQLVESSGFPLLDDEAMRAVKTAAPFDPFPSQMGEEPWNISAIFRYQSPYVHRRN